MNKTQENTDRFTELYPQYQDLLKQQHQLRLDSEKAYEEALREELRNTLGCKYKPDLPIRNVADLLQPEQRKRIHTEQYATYSEQSKQEAINQLEHELCSLASKCLLPPPQVLHKVITVTRYQYSTQTNPLFYVKARINIFKYVLEEHGIPYTVETELSLDGKPVGESIFVDTAEIGAEIVRRVAYQPINFREYVKFVVKHGNYRVLGIPIQESDFERLGIDQFGNDL